MTASTDTPSTPGATSGQVDALLVLSFGGPEGQDDVIPFLENVTRGRGIPRERLEEVATHYRHLGGRSPINDLNREIIANVEAELADRGRDLPVYFGNRNWTPMAEDTVRQMVADGVRNAAVFATSAWGGYSGCAQYQEDIARAREQVEGAPTMVRLRQFYDHPLFIERFASDLREAIASTAPGARVIFTAHSVPTSADEAAGPPSLGGHLYSRQVAEASRLVAEAAGVADYDLVWQSRSGPPSVPWLEPDVVDHVSELATSNGVTDVVIVPIGFISDHVEVIWDLDTELVDEVRELGVTVTRCATPGPSREFARMVLELLDEVETGSAQDRPGSVPALGRNRDGARCALGCCGG
ncbi:MULTISPECIES: ferrochelatase [Dietzia]|uniref:Coproporphyrin III ferrochelatase n=1 Tax=Dietzia cinnamea TaxID=321318 RepID=A0AAW5QDJ7_9ACTN|nr:MULTISPECIES: ferrochelatase [Dietzia]PWD95004.1 ferrochelatase [Dietzia maris]MBM7231478.1 ferrochelatase [Dietzia cinnamea]MCT1865709.1 ferrochelatase [Dietzia cinnamea]MCT1884397.1 ferrochelatase [Dietzia cinnamea]MCT2029383.1 ferrochelatase [Dietzia cinnamea]